MKIKKHRARISRLWFMGILFMSVQWGRTPVELSKLGPQVGQRVPDFNLKDQNGKAWTLESLLGPKGAMLVFYRSADW
jgi:peroxiredoxin